jgi:hypothetical protein
MRVHFCVPARKPLPVVQVFREKEEKKNRRKDEAHNTHWEWGFVAF